MHFCDLQTWNETTMIVIVIFKRVKEGKFCFFYQFHKMKMLLLSRVNGNTQMKSKKALISSTLTKIDFALQIQNEDLKCKKEPIDRFLFSLISVKKVLNFFLLKVSIATEGDCVALFWQWHNTGQKQSHRLRRKRENINMGRFVFFSP